MTFTEKGLIMSMDRTDLREELLAVLAANRELTGEADEYLVDRLLARIEAGLPHQSRLAEIRILYDDVVHVKVPAVIGIALAQGIVLLVLGEFMIKRVLDLSTVASAFAPAWMMFGVIWLVEVLVTIAVISVLAPRPERQRKALGSTRSINV